MVLDTLNCVLTEVVIVLLIYKRYYGWGDVGEVKSCDLSTNQNSKSTEIFVVFCLLAYDGKKTCFEGYDKMGKIR